MIEFLKRIIIPLMRWREKKLYGKDAAAVTDFEIMKESCKTVFDVKNFCDDVRYEARKPYDNYILYPGYVLRIKKAICKDIAFLFKAVFPSGDYVEIWKTPTNGHVYFVYGEHVVDFTSIYGIRIRRRQKENPIDAAAYFYGDFVFAQVNDKILSKYGM